MIMNNIYNHVSTVPIFMPVSVSKVTIVPAITIPTAISRMAFRAGIPKTHDAREPVQAPVIGNGIATRNTRKTGPYLANWLLCVCSSDAARQSSIFVRKVGYLRSQIAPICRHGTSSNTGRRLPIIDIGSTWYHGRSRI